MGNDNMITYSPEHWPFCNVKCTRKDGHWLAEDDENLGHAHDHDLETACAECMKGRIKSWA